MAKSLSVAEKFKPWIASTFEPVSNRPSWAVRSMSSNVSTLTVGRDAVAAEFHDGEAGAFRRATSVPLR